MSTANMNINVPTVGVTSGPQYATDINNAFMTVDAHDHSSGNGVSITPAGLTISSDLSFLGNNATVLKSTRFQVQSSLLSTASDIGCLYVSGVDLYYNDVSGNQVRITQSGGVAGSPGSIASLSSPASATYVSGSQTFVWQSDASTAANMDAGSLILRNITASSYGLTLNPPNAMGANYSLTLPSLPASQKIMTLDATGAMSAPYSVDNSTIEIASNVIQIKDSGVTTAKINNGAVTQVKRAALGQQAGTVNTTFSTNSTSAVSVIEATITTIGRPVDIRILPAMSGSNSNITIADNVANIRPSATIYIYRDATVIYSAAFNAEGLQYISIPASSISTVDVNNTPGTYTYTMKVAVGSSNYTFEATNIQMLVYEL